MAELRITRNRGWADRLRAYTVWVDSVKIGDIRAGQSKSFDVAPGEHHVQLRISWCGSQTLTVVAGKEPVQLACKHGIPIGMQAFAVLLSPRSWIDLRVIE